MLRVNYTKHAERYFKKLRNKALKDKYKAAIIRIRNKPDVGEAKVGDLKGIRCLNIRHDKVSYEIAYVITKHDDGRVVVIIMAGTRENFYEQLKTFMD